MEWIKKLKVNQKLNLLIFIGAFFLLVVSLVGYVYLKKSSQNIATLYNDRTLPIAWLNQMSTMGRQNEGNILKVLITDNNTKKQVFINEINEIGVKFLDLLHKYEATKLDPFEVDNLAKLKEELAAYKKVRINIVKIALSSGSKPAAAYYLNHTTEFDNFNNRLKQLAEYNQKVAAEIDTQNDKDAAMANLILLFASITALVLLISLGMMISNMITSPIKHAIDGLNIGSDELSAASSQVAAASQSLAEGASEQASAVQETSSTLEETSSMVHQNRENTQQAASLAKQAKQYAEKSHSEMNQMSDSMSELKNSSNEIAKIIKVIDEIAFQTNILSLNAAVEAARAGDAGKGFAVVAEEVRNLAQRSAQAAKDTTVIIEGNIELSDKSVNIAKVVRESVESISDQAAKVSDLLEEIAVATNEQAQGVEQINKAISQMEMALSSNAQTADESASASRALQEQAINVRDIVGSLILLVDGADAARNLSKTMVVNAPKAVVKKASVPKSLPKISKATPSPESIIPLDDF